MTVLPRSVVESSRARESLRIEAFAPEPLLVDTLFVRSRDAYVGTTLRAFDAMFGMAVELGGGPALQLVSGAEL